MELSRISKALGLNQESKIITKPVHQDSVPSAFSLKSPDQLFNSMVKNYLSLSQSIATSTLNFFDGDNSDKKLINSDTRVLHLGDSHTVGVYGHEMDNLMRATGAKVETVGSSGSSPSWYLNGTVTKSGFFSKDPEGKVDSPSNWKTPHKTPIASQLISNFKPNVIVISLGANLLHASGQQIEAEVKKLGDIAKASGAKIVWVGPPNGRADKKTPAQQDFLYQHLQNAVAKYGTFVDSREFTKYPTSGGGDGVHFWGKEGTKIAKDWANNVFNKIQESN